MSDPLVLRFMLDRDGKPGHFVRPMRGNGWRCFCSREVKVVQKKCVYASYNTKLTCAVCDMERQRWESFWDHVKAEETKDGKRQE